MFNWTAHTNKLARNRVRTFNRNVEALERRYAGTGVEIPRKITVAEVKSMVDNKADFRRIVGYKNDRSQLSRISKKVDKNAHNLTANGNIKWLDNEIKYTKIRKNKERRSTAESVIEKVVKRKAEELIPNDGLQIASEQPVYELTPVESATISVSGNVDELVGEYTTWKDLEELWGMEKAEKVRSYMYNYQAVVEEYIRPYDEDSADAIIDAIQTLYDNDPSMLKEILDSPDIEKDIEYIYDASEGGGKASAYKNIAFDSRVVMVTDYWREAANAVYR